MPNRILRDGILTSESVDALDFAEEVFYRRLQSVADDHGRFYANPKLIRAACYPLRLDRVSDDDVVSWMTACANAGLVNVYTANDGKNYIQITKFGQRIQAKSKFPDPSKSVIHGDSPLPTVENRLGVGVGVGEDEVVENTGTADAGAGQGAIKAENCPQAQIIALYHELLPELPPAREWPDANAAQLRARWRSTPERQSLDWWRKFFGYVRESDFLTGRKTDFQASLGWLVKASNFAKVVNGNYENRGRA